MSPSPKVILITGASSGIGNSMATYLAERGHCVLGTSRSEPEARNFDWIRMDVTDNDSVRLAVEEAVSRAGRIDVLINNAGLGIVGPLEETSDALVRQVLDTNVMGVLRVSRAVIPLMRERRNGLVINISSIAAGMGLPFRGIYCASKSALETLTESLSMELHPFGIKVCSVLPGDISTSINQNRLVASLRTDSVYAGTFARVHRQINREVSDAPQPAVIARAVGRIIETPSPRLHYTVGPILQRSAPLLRRLLPQRTFERIMMRFYGL